MVRLHAQITIGLLITPNLHNQLLVMKLVSGAFTRILKKLPNTMASCEPVTLKSSRKHSKITVCSNWQTAFYWPPVNCRLCVIKRILKQLCVPKILVDFSCLTFMIFPDKAPLWWAFWMLSGARRDIFHRQNTSVFATVRFRWHV